MNKQDEYKMFGCDINQCVADFKNGIGKLYTRDDLIMSLLSDVQELIALDAKEEARQLINRIKYLIVEL